MDTHPDLASLIARHTRVEGPTDTDVPGLVLMRAHGSMKRRPVVYETSLCVVAQGSKCAHLGGRTFVYDPMHYLMCALTLPVESEIRTASAERPFLGLVLRFDPALVGQLLLEMDEFVAWSDAPPREAIVSGRMNAHLVRAMTRLVGCLDDPMEQNVLAPALTREILFEVLRGPHGHVLRSRVLRDGSAHRVARVVSFLEEHYAEPVDVAAMAKQAGMSQSALHHHFKEATTLSPMQFVKKMRLHKARTLILSGQGAAEAAFAVGYNSPSQFSREFRRLFGTPPSHVRAD